MFTSNWFTFLFSLALASLRCSRLLFHGIFLRLQFFFRFGSFSSLLLMPLPRIDVVAFFLLLCSFTSFVLASVFSSTNLFFASCSRFRICLSKMVWFGLLWISIYFSNNSVIQPPVLSVLKCIGTIANRSRAHIICYAIVKCVMYGFYNELYTFAVCSLDAYWRQRQKYCVRYYGTIWKLRKMSY